MIITGGPSSTGAAAAACRLRRLSTLFCLLACLLACLPACLPAYLPAYLPACLFQTTQNTNTDGTEHSTATLRYDTTRRHTIRFDCNENAVGAGDGAFCPPGVPGVTIFMRVIISSTVGIRAPVPWAPTWWPGARVGGDGVREPPFFCSLCERDTPCAVLQYRTLLDGKSKWTNEILRRHPSASSLTHTRRRLVPLYASANRPLVLRSCLAGLRARKEGPRFRYAQSANWDYGIGLGVDGSGLPFLLGRPSPLRRGGPRRASLGALGRSSSQDADRPRAVPRTLVRRADLGPAANLLLRDRAEVLLAEAEAGRARPQELAPRSSRDPARGARKGGEDHRPCCPSQPPDGREAHSSFREARLRGSPEQI